MAGSGRYARMRPDCAEAETGLRGSPVTRRGGDLDHVVVSRKPTELNRQSALGRHLAREALRQSRARSARRWLTAWRLTASALWFVLVGTCSRPPRHQAGRLRAHETKTCVGSTWSGTAGWSALPRPTGSVPGRSIGSNVLIQRYTTCARPWTLRFPTHLTSRLRWWQRCTGTETLVASSTSTVIG